MSKRIELPDEMTTIKYLKPQSRVLLLPHIRCASQSNIHASSADEAEVETIEAKLLGRAKISLNNC